MRASEHPGRVITSQPRRVRVVHLLLTMDVGGLERVALDLARKSDPERFDCRIVCIRDPGDLAPVARELGVRVEALGARGWVDGVYRLTRRLLQIGPHVLHTHNPGAHRVGVPARLLARIPVLIHTKHGRNQPDNPRAVAMNRRLARFSDAIVAVSHDAARVALEIEHIPVTKVQVIHNGVEPGEPLSASGVGLLAAASHHGGPVGPCEGPAHDAASGPEGRGRVPGLPVSTSSATDPIARCSSG